MVCEGEVLLFLSRVCCALGLVDDFFMSKSLCLHPTFAIPAFNVWGLLVVVDVAGGFCYCLLYARPRYDTEYDSMESDTTSCKTTSNRYDILRVPFIQCRTSTSPHNCQCP